MEGPSPACTLHEARSTRDEQPECDRPSDPVVRSQDVHPDCKRPAGPSPEHPSEQEATAAAQVGKILRELKADALPYKGHQHTCTNQPARSYRLSCRKEVITECLMHGAASKHLSTKSRVLQRLTLGCHPKGGKPCSKFPHAQVLPAKSVLPSRKGTQLRQPQALYQRQRWPLLPLQPW